MSAPMGNLFVSTRRIFTPAARLHGTPKKMNIFEGIGTGPVLTDLNDEKDSKEMAQLKIDNPSLYMKLVKSRGLRQQMAQIITGKFKGRVTVSAESDASSQDEGDQTMPSESDDSSDDDVTKETTEDGDEENSKEKLIEDEPITSPTTVCEEKSADWALIARTSREDESTPSTSTGSAIRMPMEGKTRSRGDLSNVTSPSTARVAARARARCLFEDENQNETSTVL